MQLASASAYPPDRSSVYLIAGQRFETSSPGFADAVARAHAEHRRPRCLCRPGGIDMYVARLTGPNDGFIVKRMPETGSCHAPDCPSYEPPAEFSGLGGVLGSAIVEDPATGQTTLKLDFPFTKLPGRSTLPPTGDGHDSAKSAGIRLSLRGLLHYLWDQAELTRWQPGFTGRRSWAMVRRYLLAAAENKVARGDPLLTRLYVPEAFSVEQRDVLNARRMVHWSRALPRPGQSVQHLVLIGEVKEIVPARYGYKAVIKHVPDQAFLMDASLYRRMDRCFKPELSLWGAADGLHMVAIATFGLSRAGVPTIDEMSLMPVTSDWIVVQDSLELQLVDRLVREGRSFIKALRYNEAADDQLPSALLTDTDNAPTPLAIDRCGGFQTNKHRLNDIDVSRDDHRGAWWWSPSAEQMPDLPPRHHGPS